MFFRLRGRRKASFPHLGCVQFRRSCPSPTFPSCLLLTLPLATCSFVVSCLSLDTSFTASWAEWGTRAWPCSHSQGLCQGSAGPMATARVGPRQRGVSPPTDRQIQTGSLGDGSVGQARPACRSDVASALLPAAPASEGWHRKGRRSDPLIA